MDLSRIFGDVGAILGGARSSGSVQVGGPHAGAYLRWGAPQLSLPAVAVLLLVVFLLARKG